VEFIDEKFDLGKLQAQPLPYYLRYDIYDPFKVKLGDSRGPELRWL
jgi:hypothetical protein